MELVDGVLTVPCLEHSGRLVFSGGTPHSDPDSGGSFAVAYEFDDSVSRQWGEGFFGACRAEWSIHGPSVIDERIDSFLAKCAAGHASEFERVWGRESRDLEIRVRSDGRGRFWLSAATPPGVDWPWSACGTVVLDTASMDRLAGLFGAFLKG